MDCSLLWNQPLIHLCRWEIFTKSPEQGSQLGESDPPSVSRHTDTLGSSGDEAAHYFYAGLPFDKYSEYVNKTRKGLMNA